MTGEIYDELVTNRYTGFNISPTPWVIVIIRKDMLDCKRAVTNFNMLAKQLKGATRFAWVDRNSEELLAETFGARQLPATFIILNGTVY